MKKWWIRKLKVIFTHFLLNFALIFVGVANLYSFYYLERELVVVVKLAVGLVCGLHGAASEVVDLTHLK